MVKWGTHRDGGTSRHDKPTFFPRTPSTTGDPGPEVASLALLLLRTNAFGFIVPFINIHGFYRGVALACGACPLYVVVACASFCCGVKTVLAVRGLGCL